VTVWENVSFSHYTCKSEPLSFPLLSLQEEGREEDGKEGGREEGKEGALHAVVYWYTLPLAWREDEERR